MTETKGSIMVFRPTMEEFRDFSSYIQHMEDQGAHTTSGVAKVIPPKEWSARPNKGSDYSDALHTLIKAPVQSSVSFGAVRGSFIKHNSTVHENISVHEFGALARSKKHQRPIHSDLDLSVSSQRQMDSIEKLYWSSVHKHKPLYGSDAAGSLTENSVQNWNMNGLGTILDDIQSNFKVNINGVNTPNMYYGTWGSPFAWHVEDLDLYSINLLHYGQPKFWYSMPSSEADKFEAMCDRLFPEAKSECAQFMRHKDYMISPDLLRKNNINFSKIAQFSGEFMITFPKGYHAGFNMGYNAAEAINFASQRWIDIGMKSTVCVCDREFKDDPTEAPVRYEYDVLDMFVKNYRTRAQYQQWQIDYKHLEQFKGALSNYRSREERPPLQHGEDVVVSLDDGSAARGRVGQQIDDIAFVCIDFDDGSITDNCYECDVIDCACPSVPLAHNQGHDHVIGSRITIDWFGKQDTGMFTGLRLSSAFQVHVSDGRVLECPREDIYKKGETIPDQVSALLGTEDDDMGDTY